MQYVILTRYILHRLSAGLLSIVVALLPGPREGAANYFFAQSHNAIIAGYLFCAVFLRRCGYSKVGGTPTSWLSLTDRWIPVWQVTIIE